MWGGGGSTWSKRLSAARAESEVSRSWGRVRAGVGARVRVRVGVRVGVRVRFWVRARVGVGVGVKSWG